MQGEKSYMWIGSDVVQYSGDYGNQCILYIIFNHLEVLSSGKTVLNLSRAQSVYAVVHAVQEKDLHRADGPVRRKEIQHLLHMHQT